MRINHLGQPVGDPVPGWTTRPRPPRTPIVGNYCRIEPLDPAKHAESLYASYQQDPEGRNWTYLPVEPPKDLDSYRRWLTEIVAKDDPLFHAIIDIDTDEALGIASLMRIEPSAGVIEVGHINFSPRLQGTTAATEAMYLLMKRVFDELGYRRYEWKCDSLNEPSCRAAERFGFTYEGTFRQHWIVKGRNRDTSWFSILDSEWPKLRDAFEAWLSPNNFDDDGEQKRRLTDFRA
ncbi:MAG TPA: GNAT family protein [Vicinamibacterales bacterium]|nr:GNAT family protein [Vicinamibacterales bacterium]